MLIPDQGQEYDRQGCRATRFESWSSSNRTSSLLTRRTDGVYTQATDRGTIIQGRIKTSGVQYDEAAFSNVMEALAHGAAAVKITDFGMAMRMGSHESHASDVQRGTFFYMAPETKKYHQLHTASDVYAFGIMMWELMMGALVYTARYASGTVLLRRQNMNTSVSLCVLLP